VLSSGLSRVPGLQHGFTLRTWGDFAGTEPGLRLLARTGARALRLLRQVHGIAVIGADDEAVVPEGDAWAGRPAPGVLLGVCTADCLPVLLCHPPSRTLGLAHAGWRGAVAGIAEATLKAMRVPAEEIVAALGPSIGPCCYEVGADVARGAAGSRRVQEKGGGKFWFDLPGFVGDRLAEAGVAPGNVERLGLCTGCRTDLFYSYRREGRTGRLCAFMGWQDR